MFTINGIEWDVVYVDPFSNDLHRSDGTLTVGVCDLELKTIFISNMLQGKFLRKVLLHETCHAAMFSYSIFLTIEQEELFCDLLATYGDEIVSIVDDMFGRLRKVV